MFTINEKIKKKRIKVPRGQVIRGKLELPLNYAFGTCFALAIPPPHSEVTDVGCGRMNL